MPERSRDSRRFFFQFLARCYQQWQMKMDLNNCRRSVNTTLRRIQCGPCLEWCSHDNATIQELIMLRY